MSYSQLVLDSLAWAQGFARACAAKFPRHVNRDDLQSAGMLGYVKAAQRYDISKGASFRGFCAVRIRGAILDELRRWDWASRSIHKSCKRNIYVTQALTDDLGDGSTPAEFAEAGVDEKNVPVTELLPDPHGKRPDHAVLKAEDHHALLQSIGKLPETEAMVIVLHYLRNVPLRKVAPILTVSPSRVSQLHRQALRRLRGCLENDCKSDVSKP